MTELKDTIKQQNKIASDWLVYYRERKMEHEEKRQELYSKRDKAVGLSTGLSKPTEGLAINLADYDLGNEARWLETVETVYNMVGRKKQLLIRLRQECKFYVSSHGGRPGWIAPVQVRFGDETGFIPAERTLHEMWSSIVSLTIIVAMMKNIKFSFLPQKTPRKIC